MRRNSIIKHACFAAILALSSPLAFSQDASALKPPPYRGVQVHVDGVYVTPVSGVPLTAVVNLESSQILENGSSEVKKTINNIARDSQGRIYNERRRMVSISFPGTPRLLSFHIFDPETKLSTFLDPFTHIARQTVRPMPPNSAEVKPAASAAASNPLIQEEDLGTQTMEGVIVHGTRTTRTIPASTSGTGSSVVITDEYWYSDELHLNMLTKHDDPRSGHQTVTVTQVNRSEPNASLFEIPADYKVVDETPEPRQ